MCGITWNNTFIENGAWSHHREIIVILVDERWLVVILEAIWRYEFARLCFSLIVVALIYNHQRIRSTRFFFFLNVIVIHICVVYYLPFLLLPDQKPYLWFYLEFQKLFKNIAYHRFLYANRLCFNILKLNEIAKSFYIQRWNLSN